MEKKAESGHMEISRKDEKDQRGGGRRGRKGEILVNDIGQSTLSHPMHL